MFRFQSFVLPAAPVHRQTDIKIVKDASRGGNTIRNRQPEHTYKKSMPTPKSSRSVFSRRTATKPLLKKTRCVPGPGPELLADHIPVGIAVLSADLRFEYLNPYFTKIFGYTVKDLPDVNAFFRKTYPDPVQRKEAMLLWRRDLARSPQQGRVFEREFRIHCKTGENKFVYMRSVVMAGGRQVLTYQDISERKQIEEALKLSDEKFTKAFQNSAASMAITSIEEGRFIEVNERFLKTLDLKRNEVIGKTTEELNIYADPGQREAIVRIVKGEGSARDVPVRINSRRGLLAGLLSVDIIRVGDVKFFLTITQDITDRTKAEETLRIKDAAIESAQIGVGLADLKGTVTYVNEAYVKLWKYKNKGEIVGRPISDFMLDKSLFPTVCESVRTRGKFFGEGKAVREDGTTFDTQVSVNLVADANGNPLCMMASFLDVTERNRADAILKESEKKYRLIAEHTGDIIATMDLNYKLTYISPSVFKMRGYTPEEMIGRPLDMIFTPDSLRKVRALLEEHFALEASGKQDPDRTVTEEFEEYCKDGSIKWVEIACSFLRDHERRVTGIVTITRDITARKQAEESLKESERQRQVFMNSTPDIVFLKDEQLRYVMVNDAQAEFCGKPQSEMIGKTDLDIMPESVALNCSLSDRKVLQSFGAITVHEQVGDRIYEVRKFPVKIKGGKTGVGAYIRDITGIQKVEQALRANEETLRSLFNASKESILLVSRSGELLTANDIFAERVGKRVADCIGRSIFSLFPEDVSVRRREIMAEVIRTAQPKIFEDERQGRWFYISMMPVLDESGAVDRIAVYAIDITERKKTEDSLRESEARFRSLIESAPECIFLQSAGRFVYLNDAACRLFGAARPEDLLGKNFMEMMAPEYRDMIRERIRLQKETGNPAPLMEQEYLRMDGSRVPVETTAVSITYQNTDAHMVFIRDITERKRIERALRESQTQLESIFLAAPIAIGLVSDRILLKVNSLLCQMTGYASEELVGKSARILYPDDEEYGFVGRVKYAQIREHGTGTVETKWKCKNGQILDILLSSTALDIRDLSAGVICVALDITGRKKAEENIRASLQEKEVLLREIDHRVKNNLQIINSLYNLQAEKSKDVKVRGILKECQARVKSISLVHEKLYQSRDLARINMEEYVESLVKSIVYLFAIDTTQISVDIDVEKDIGLGIDKIVNCGLIINELVTNACKYAFPAGKNGVIYIGLRKSAGDEYELTVSDNGVGIPEGVNITSTETLGLELVRLLAGQMGSFQFDRRNGTTVKILIKNEKQKYPYR
jgi:PAS domain S-box-containing protein